MSGWWGEAELEFFQRFTADRRIQAGTILPMNRRIINFSTIMIRLASSLIFTLPLVITLVFLSGGCVTTPPPISQIEDPIELKVAITIKPEDKKTPYHIEISIRNRSTQPVKISTESKTKIGAFVDICLIPESSRITVTNTSKMWMDPIGWPRILLTLAPNETMTSVWRTDLGLIDRDLPPGLRCHLFVIYRNLMWPLYEKDPQVWRNIAVSNVVSFRVPNPKKPIHTQRQSAQANNGVNLDLRLELKTDEITYDKPTPMRLVFHNQTMENVLFPVMDGSLAAGFCEFLLLGDRGTTIVTDVLPFWINHVGKPVRLARGGSTILFSSS